MKLIITKPKLLTKKEERQIISKAKKEGKIDLDVLLSLSDEGQNKIINLFNEAQQNEIIADIMTQIVELNFKHQKEMEEVGNQLAKEEKRKKIKIVKKAQ